MEAWPWDGLKVWSKQGYRSRRQLWSSAWSWCVALLRGGKGSDRKRSSLTPLRANVSLFEVPSFFFCFVLSEVNRQYTQYSETWSVIHMSTAEQNLWNFAVATNHHKANFMFWLFFYRPLNQSIYLYFKLFFRAPGTFWKATFHWHFSHWCTVCLSEVSLFCVIMWYSLWFVIALLLIFF